MCILKSVGRSGSNDFSDAKVVQTLFNLNRSRFPGNAPDRLQVDGNVGPITIEAIGAFQTEVVDLPRALGVVVPGDLTYRWLLEGPAKGYSREKLVAVMPSAPSSSIALYHAAIRTQMAARGIDSPLRIAHFLAQIGHESGSLIFAEELASGDAYENRIDLGNTQLGDGRRFKGRGLIQLTGRANYTLYTQDTGTDYVAHPELLASDPIAAADVACWYWQRHNLNTLADRDDVTSITKVVNGGFNGLDDRAAFLRRARVLVGADRE